MNDVQADRRRYEAAAHAMQSGVKQEIENELGHLNLPDTLMRFLKHERTGINSAMSDVGAISGLLIARGCFTEAEYVKAVADAMEREKDRYEKHLSALLGVKITLA